MLKDATRIFFNNSVEKIFYVKEYGLIRLQINYFVGKVQ